MKKSLIVGFLLVFTTFWNLGQVRNPNVDKIVRQALADQDNPNHDNPITASKWLKEHRRKLYEVCKKAVKGDTDSIRLLDKKLDGKSDSVAVDIMTEFLDGLLK
jgi:hypothetical protein